MKVNPQDVLASYRSLEEHRDKDLTMFIAGAFSKMHRFGQQAHHISDPVAGEFFQWQHPDYPGLVLEVVGQLDGMLSMVLYKPHPMLNARQTHLDARVELVRSLMQIKGADLSRVDGIIMPSRARGRPVYTAELLTIELLRMVAGLLGVSGSLAANPTNVAAPAVSTADRAAIEEAQAQGFVTVKDLEG